MSPYSKKNNSTSNHHGDGRRHCQVNVLCSSSLLSRGQARSAAEASMDQNSSKFRQLPCKTFVSVGTCPFGERCVFLHDPRLICSSTHSITRMKNREDTAVDTFFWPACLSEAAAKNLEHNFHPYNVPAPKNDQYVLHDQALYSMWMHHVEFCRTNSKAQKSLRTNSISRVRTVLNEDLPVNPFTHRGRLPVFQLLSSSNSQDIAPEQFRMATYVDHSVQQHQVQMPSLRSMSSSSPPAAAAAAVILDQVEHQQLQYLKRQNEIAMAKLTALQQSVCAPHRQLSVIAKVYQRTGAPAHRSPTSTAASVKEAGFDLEYHSSGHTSPEHSDHEEDDVSSLSSNDSAPPTSELERRRRQALLIISKSEAIQMANKKVLQSHTNGGHFVNQSMRYSQPQY